MDGNEFLDYARELVSVMLDVRPSQVKVVWASKMLQNNKAMLYPETTGKYVEVTYNGSKNETYVDTYVKETNKVFKGYEELTTRPKQR